MLVFSQAGVIHAGLAMLPCCDGRTNGIVLQSFMIATEGQMASSFSLVPICSFGEDEVRGVFLDGDRRTNGVVLQSWGFDGRTNGVVLLS